MTKPLPLLKIRELRKKCGLRQHQLAAMLSVTQARISEYETGTKLPSVERLPTIASALNCTVNDLFAPPAKESEPADGQAITRPI